MCRIAYIPKPDQLEERDMVDLFWYLEQSMGGEGNGLALTWPDNTIEAFKGLDDTVEELAMIAKCSSGPILFHTRRATSGGVCDALCQPFVIGDMAFAHNGIWGDWDDVAIELLIQGDMDGNKPINDSLTAAAFVAKYGRYALEAISLGVFVVMKPDGTWLHLRAGSFAYCPDLGIYASAFPKKDWPRSKDIAIDSIALLTADGPEFQCGGWREHNYHRVIGDGYERITKPYTYVPQT